MNAQLVALPGDGIGPDVTSAGLRVLAAVAEQHDHSFTISEHPIGGAAIDKTGHPLPPETLSACRSADAVLLGAIGGPQWDDPLARVRPEQGLLKLRSGLGLYANLRPIRLFPCLAGSSALAEERLKGGIDFVIVRELTSGIYFGPRKETDACGRAMDTMTYTRDEVSRIAHIAFRAAEQRAGRLISVDKANVLATSRLWRSVVTSLGADYPGITVEHMLVDAAAMALIRQPETFDVLLTGNLFGDILSDEASMLAGSLGMLPSACLGDDTIGVYEPVHGSAPDLAGQDIANPIASILSVAMLLRYSLQLTAEADAVERAVARALDRGVRTADIAPPNIEPIGTQGMTDRIIREL